MHEKSGSGMRRSIAPKRTESVRRKPRVMHETDAMNRIEKAPVDAPALNDWCRGIAAVSSARLNGSRGSNSPDGALSSEHLARRPRLTVSRPVL